MKIARLILITVPMLALWLAGVLVGFAADISGWSLLERANDRLAEWFAELEEAL